MSYILVEESAFQRLVERIDALEHRNPLNRATISRPPGLELLVPDAVHVKPGASIGVEGEGGLDVKNGGSVKFGTAGKIGQSGSKIGITGNVEGTGGAKFGELEAVGAVKGGSAAIVGHVQGGTVTGAGLVKGGTLESVGQAKVGSLDSVAGAKIGGDLEALTMKSLGRLDAVGKISGGGAIEGAGDVSGGSVTSRGRMDAVGKISGGGDIEASNNLLGAGALISGHMQGESIGSSGGIVAGGGIVAEGVVQGRDGLRTPWGSSTALVKDIAEQIQGTANGGATVANNAYDLAASKPSQAYVDAQDAAAESTANSAATIASQTKSIVDGIQNGSETLSNPKIGGIGSVALGGNWKVLAFNPATGRIGYAGD